jgi:aminocarboxymuconate-semialdehyde decarboxylase
MLSVDIHNHVTPAAYLKAVRDAPQRMGSRIERDDAGREWLVMDNGRSTQVRQDFVDPALRLQAMAEAQIDVIVESILPPLFHYWADIDQAVRVCRSVNDAIADNVARHPGRIVGMGMVPLQQVTEAVRELERIVRELDMASVIIGTNVNDKNLDEPELFPFFECAQDLDVLVFVHPHEVTARQRLRRYYLTNWIGNPLETSIAFASLIFGGVLERLPRLKVCFAHAGGYTPWIRGRWRHGYSHCDRGKPEAVLTHSIYEYMQRCYFDTVIFDELAIEYLIRAVGSDHVVHGTDYPSDMGIWDQIPLINSFQSITQTDKDKILGANAATLLKLTGAGFANR